MTGMFLTLPGAPESVRQFRAWARESSATDYQAEAAALCISEIVTNAISHTRSGLPGGMVTASISPGTYPGELRISVCDDGPRVPVADAALAELMDGCPPAAPAADPAEGGRGLAIVDTVATDWGILRGRSGICCVWCEIPVTADQAVSTTEPAPLGARP